MNRPALLVLASAVALTACTSTRAPGPVTRPAPRASSGLGLVPLPQSLRAGSGAPFTITATTAVVVDAGNAEVARTGEMLAALIRPSTAFAVPVGNAAAAGQIALRLVDNAALGDEGYELAVTSDSVRISAYRPAGLFRGTQTLRQLLPFEIESHMGLSSTQWTVTPVSITDRPRFGWRGAMLDVARHFFTVDEVKQYMDLLALYKLNVLHLHLADDQGWRIEIKSRPKLVAMGSATQVGGGAGGFFTQDDYAEILRYATERYITIVPEIDMPSHTNAALVAYPELSCSKEPPVPYTGTEVGFSTLCSDKEETYALVDDVVREMAAMTPGRYIHLGGDENKILTRDQYVRFVERVQGIVSKYGKQLVGWEEISHARLVPTTLVQAWASDTVAAAALQYGAKVLMSPGPRMYIDMKYNDATELGLKWAGLIEVQTAYDWDPATYMKGVGEANIVGIEAPMWSETVRNITAVEFLAVPRLPALAEVGWTPQATRDWGGFRERIATHGPRWNLLGINFYRSPQIPW